MDPISDERLRRGLRDLVAVTALPSLCVGRSRDEALDILVDALPTALTCDLVYLQLPDQERAVIDGAPPTADQLDEIRMVLKEDERADVTLFLGAGRVWCVEADLPIAGARGRLLAGRFAPLDPEIDRMLIRSAANVVGTILQTAKVLEQAQDKDAFLAILGHELRNPLAPIVTAIDLLRDSGAVARERDVIERHTQHLVRMVDDLLDISRVTRGQVELRREPVLLRAVLERATEIVAPLVTRRQHRLELGDAGDIALEGDPIRLAQIFGNLLTNAAKFTPPGGRIDVVIARRPGRVAVTVRDTGCGIAKDQQRRIFEPFVQADRERDALQGGLGLGLAIVRSLVERHGGSIAVHSEGRGHGAAFTVDLPTARASSTHAAARPPQPSDARAQIRVLVVDDNVDIAMLLSEALQKKGFRTEVANDGRDALRNWREFRPHAGVLDVGLPGLDGYELARALRAEHGPGATLIALTGYARAADRARAKEAGFDHHLVKPVSLDELIRMLDQQVVAAASDD